MEPKLRAREIQAFSDFRSADGSFGETNATGGLTFKNGLYVGGTMSATSTSIAPDSVTVVGTGGNGFVAFAAQSSPPVQSLAHIYASPAGAIILGHSGSTAYAVEFNNGLLNANRVLHVPNKSGTIATTSDNVSQFTNDAGYVPSSRTLSAGVGLTGGGNLSADRSFVLGTPSSLAVGTGNSVSGTTHTHAITSSSNPGAAAVILATDTSGFLRLTRLGIGASPTQPLQVAGNAFIDASTANLYMKDTSTGFQVSATGVINLQTGNTLRTAPFTAGVEGWNISWDGDAEFNNVRVRGELAASVFKVSELSATAGTFGVFYSASTLTVDCLTAAVPGAGMSITAKNSDAGAMLFGVGDKVRIKSWTGTAVADVWATIQSRTNNGPDTTYSAIFESGTASAYFVAGTAVVDYGPSGSGFITLSADGTVGATPNITMATHAGSPWSAQTVFYKAGNLDLSYGYGSTTYGVGLGRYESGQSWLTFDTTNGIRIGNGTAIVLGQWDTGGNMTLGQVVTDQANVFWNSSNKRLEFRGSTGGTTVQTYVDTDGSFTAAGGAVRLNSFGLRIEAADGITADTSAYTWTKDTHNVGGLYNTYYPGTGASVSLRTRPKSTDTTSYLTEVALLTQKPNGDVDGEIRLTTTQSANKTKVNIVSALTPLGGVVIGSYGNPTHMLEVNGSGWFKPSATDTALAIRAAVATTGAVLLSAENTAVSANTPMELRATQFDFSTGSVRMRNYGAGTATFDASGNLTSSSDEKLKVIKGDFLRGLEALKELRPIRYLWTKESGLDRSQEYVGLGARHTKRHIPEAIGQSSNGFHTMSDRVILATIINAIKELDQKYESLSAARAA